MKIFMPFCNGMNTNTAPNRSYRSNAVGLPGLKYLLGICFLLISFYAGAQRYAVAPGDWNSTATWSATSGGAPGASVPAAGTDVFINSNVAVTVTTGAAAVCNNISVSAGSLSLSTAGLTIGAANSLTLTGGTVNLNAQTLSFAGAGSIVCNGGTFNAGTSTVTTAVASPGIFSISGSQSIALSTLTFTSNGRFDNTNNGTVINGTFNINNNGFTTGTAGCFAPIYGSGSTLAINFAGAAISSSFANVWSTGVPGIIGVTRGYPNNVSLNGQLNNNTFMAGGIYSLAGSFTIAAGSHTSITTMFIGGSLNFNGGTFNGSATYYFCGTTTQTINGSPTFTGTVHIVNTAASVVLGNNITVTGGTLNIRGVLDVGATYLVSGTGITTVSALAAATTTMSGTIGTQTVTVASAAGLATGMTVSATGVPAGTVITSVAGTTLTLSQALTSTLSAAAVTFSRGGTLRTAHVQGILTTGAFGSIRTTTRNYSSGSFEFNGTVNQTTFLPANVQNLKINNTASGGKVTVNTGVGAVSAAGTVSMTNGILDIATNANSLAVTNTSNNAVTGGITGGSSTSFINDAVTWSLPSGATGTYAFPVGTSTGYMAFAFNPVTTSAITATVKAFATGTGGGGTGLTLSTTEYWSLVTSGLMGSGGTIASLQRYPSTIATGTIIAENNTAPVNSASAYVNIGGTASNTNTITGSGASIGNTITSYFSLAIVPPVISSAATASGTETVPFSYTITATNTPASFGVTGTLPSGVTLNTTTGVISGTPPVGAAGTYTVDITATNAAGTSTPVTLTITISPLTPPSVTSANTAGGTEGSAFSYTITATNSPTSYGVTGTLPSGVTLNTSTGAITGTPPAGANGTYNVSIYASNAAGPGLSQALTITIAVGPIPVITSANTASAQVIVPFTYNITATNSPTSYSIVGTLPSGLSLNTTTGAITGTPAGGSNGTYPVTIRATNIYGTGTQALTITVSAGPVPTVTSAGTASGTVGSAFSYTITATNSPTSFGVTGTLPSGVTLNTTTGAITGTPAAGSNGSYPVTINATNANGTSTSQALTITIANAVYYFQSKATGNWNNTATWNFSTASGGPWTAATIVPGPGAQFIEVMNGHTVTLTASSGNLSNGVKVNAGGVLVVNNGTVLSISASTLTVWGTLDVQTGAVVSGAGAFSLPDADCNNTFGTLKIGDAAGITTGATGSIQVSGTRTFGFAFYEYTCSSTGTTQFTGNALPATVKTLTINRSASTDIVSLTNNVIVKHDQCGGILNLTRGIFSVGIARTITFDNGSSINTINNPNAAGTANFATTGANGGEDGGTVIAKDGSGANLTINGPGLTTFYNLQVGNGTAGNGNRTINPTSANIVRINGTLSTYTDQYSWSGFSPIYGPVSTLSVNNNNQAYTPGGTTKKEWVAIAPGAGTIGTTAGYPNNVILKNVGTSYANDNGTNVGCRPTGNWSINGTLTIGDASTSGVVSIAGMSSFSCGGVLIDNNSTLVGASFTNYGNWRRQGTTIGKYVNVGTGTVTFAGGTGSAAPQIISISTVGGAETQLNNVTLSGTNTYVKLNSPLTIASGAILTLTNGILETSSSNILYVTNTAVAGISGTGSATTFINGPVKRDVILASTYTLPLGKLLPSAAYLPLAIRPLTASSNTITVEAFNANCAGAPDGTTVTSISNTEYWSLTATTDFSTGAAVSAGRSGGVGSFNMLAKSTVVNGIYSAIGGSTGTVGGISGIVDGAVTGTPAPWYIVMAYGPLNINVTSVTYPSCTGTNGAVTVAGSGGVPPYQYNKDGGAYQASGTFGSLAAGSYTFGVRDNAGTIKTIVVQLDVMVATTDTGTCAGGSIQLQANAASAWSYSWSPATGLSSTTIANPVATPASTTTYTVTGIVVDETVNALGVNAGFEGAGYGFDWTYINHTCGAYNSSWADPSPTAGVWPCNGQAGYTQQHNGVFKVAKNAKDLCTNLANFGPRTGDSMLVVDGPNNNAYSGSYFWRQQNIPVTANTNYIFTYWVRNAFTSSTADDAIVRTKINNVSVTGTVAYPNPKTASSTGWEQVSYLWNSGASTTATIEMFDERVADAANDFAIDDMSFYITCSPQKTVTVTISPTPTLGVVSPPTQVCIGQGAVVNMTGLTPSATFTVNYTINGVTQVPVTGVTSNVSGNASFTTVLLTAANNGQTLEVISLTNTVAHSSCTQTFTGKSTTLTVNPVVTWIGGSGTSWNIDANWCGGIPTASTDVLIPDYGTSVLYPEVLNGNAGACKTITISNNASVTTTGTGTLSVAGSFLSNGTLINNGTLVLNSTTTTQSFPGATGTIAAMNNLTANNTFGVVTFNRNFSISGTFTPQAGTVNVDNVVVTLTSTPTSTARVGVVTGTVTYTAAGKFAVERYYPAKRSWRLVTVPLYETGTIFDEWQLSGADYAPSNVGKGLLVSGPGATYPIGPDGLDSSYQQNSSMKMGTSLTPVSNTKVSLSRTTGGFPYNIGYFLFVRGDRDFANTIIPNSNNTTVTSTGKLQTGPQTFAASATAGGFTLVGNPYVSPVDFKSVINSSSNTSSNILNKFYAWDPHLGSAQGAYVIADDLDGNGTYTMVPSSPGGQNEIIQSGQAIFIITNAAGAASLTFNETDKSAQNNLGIFRPGVPPVRKKAASFRTNLYLVEPGNNTILADGNLVLFDNQYNDAVDSKDALKISNINETFAVLNRGRALGLERRSPLTQEDTIFFKLTKSAKRNYRFEFIVDKPGRTNLAGFLEDNFNHTATAVNLTGTTVFDFSITSDPLSAAPDRFRVVFKPMVRYASIKASQVNNDVTVQWSTSSELNIKEYEIEKSLDAASFSKLGVQQASGNNNNTEAKYAWIDPAQSPGVYYYRVRTVNESGEVAYSDIVKVEIERVEPLVTVYPNPVTTGTINLQMKGMPAGVYKTNLLSGTGQLMQVKNINHAAGTATENIKLNKPVAKGIYHLEVNGPANYSAKIKVLID
ncbi:MAG: putative Ig domain-containing protein [Ferruginibacter sp.]